MDIHSREVGSLKLCPAETHFKPHCLMNYPVVVLHLSKALLVVLAGYYVCDAAKTYIWWNKTYWIFYITPCLIYYSVNLYETNVACTVETLEKFIYRHQFLSDLPASPLCLHTSSCLLYQYHHSWWVLCSVLCGVSAQRPLPAISLMFLYSCRVFHWLLHYCLCSLSLCVLISCLHYHYHHSQWILSLHFCHKSFMFSSLQSAKVSLPPPLFLLSLLPPPVSLFIIVIILLHLWHARYSLTGSSAKWTKVHHI